MTIDITADTANRGPVLFEAGMASMGWEVHALELDLVRGRGRLELCRRDGRLVTLDAQGGRATITREHLFESVAVVGRRGDRIPVRRVGARFLGRSHHEGVRSGLKALAHYVADNSSTERLQARNLFRLIMRES